MPQFSVIIPTFNRAAFVTGAVESVLAQDFDGFEVIVVDDGSTDDTAPVLRDRFGDDPRIRVVRQQHSERGAARNRGMREAEGEFVVFLDSDDRFLPNHLSVLRSALERNPEAEIVSTRYDLVRDGARRPSDLVDLGEGWHGLEAVLGGNPFACNLCVRRKLDGLVPFRETERYESEDWVFLVSNLARRRLWLAGEVTMLMTDHSKRTMRGDPAGLADAKTAAVRWILENVPLSRAESRAVAAHAARFCALHEHLSGHRSRAIASLWRAIVAGGPAARDAVLLTRIALGPRLAALLARGARGGGGRR